MGVKKEAKKSAHCHADECAHAAVKFCADCGKVYCEACKREWGEPAPAFVPSPFHVEPPRYPQAPSLLPWEIHWRSFYGAAQSNVGIGRTFDDPTGTYADTRGTFAEGINASGDTYKVGESGEHVTPTHVH